MRPQPPHPEPRSRRADEPREAAQGAPEAEGSGWQESAGLLAVAALTLMALLV